MNTYKPHYKVSRQGPGLYRLSFNNRQVEYISRIRVGSRTFYTVVGMSTPYFPTLRDAIMRACQVFII